MDWQKRLEYMAEAENKIRSADVESVKKIHESGKHTAIERMNELFDQGTFVETGAYVTAGSGAYEGVITGYGAVNGRLVYAYAQDYSRQSGAFGAAYAKKITTLYDLAAANGAPVVCVFDSAGVKVEEGISAAAGYGSVMKKAASLSGVIPQIAVVCGVCSGGASVIANLCDFIFIERKNGKIYMTPPFIVEHSSETKPDGTTGSADFCLKSGMAARAAESEPAVFADVKSLLNFLPSNNMEDGIYTESFDDINRLNENLENLYQTEYDIKYVIGEIADGGVFYETGAEYSESMVCGFISIGGISVGVVANQRLSRGGALCAGAARKAAKFIAFCDSFNIPILTLTDTEGMLISEKSEKSPFPEHAAKLAAAYAGAAVPKITLIVGKAYGTAYVLMGSKQLGADMTLAYPTARIGILPPETAVNFLMSDKISSPEDRVRLTEQWEIETMSPVSASEEIDHVIKPAQTRQIIASCLFSLQNKRESSPPRRHGNISI